MYCILLKH